MPLTRAEAANKRDGDLALLIDGCRYRLRRDWDAGAPGKLSDVYDLAVCLAEAAVRGLTVPGPVLHPDQLRLPLEFA